MRNFLIFGGMSLALCTHFSAKAQPSDIVRANNVNGINKSTNSPASAGWTGAGELGFASARGNSRSDNLNVKLNLSQDTQTWKNNVSFNALRSTGLVSTTEPNGSVVNQTQTTANRYDTSLSIGYKFNPRNYVVSTVRYEHDNFGVNLWAGSAALGYGYIALNGPTFELTFELGPGIKRYQPNGSPRVINGTSVTVYPPIKNQGVARALVQFAYHINSGTTLQNNALVEAGGGNTFWQNDLSLSVSMTKKLSLKVGYQVQYNSNIVPGYQHTNMLTTTNLVYNF